MRLCIAALLFVSLYACSTTTRESLGDVSEMPAWQGTIYVGDASKSALVRSQSNTTLSCQDPKFSEMICMHFADFQDLIGQIRFMRHELEKQK